jgi:Uma2 family endonuclease
MVDRAEEKLGPARDKPAEGSIAMATITLDPPVSTGMPSTPPPRSLYRMSLAKYEAMIRSGIFTNRDRLVLIEGYLVEKMTQYPPHTISQELCRSDLARVIPSGWHVRGEKPLRIPSRVSMPEPDVVVARGEIRDYLAGDPEPDDVALVVEVSDSSLDDDRNMMTRVYGGGGVTRYWIVNLVDRQVEVYSSPSGSREQVGFRHCEVYRIGQEVPVLIDGIEVGRISVAAILP